VTIVALPDAVISTLAGLYDVLNGAAMMGITGPGQRSISVRIVGESPGPLRLASGVPVEVQAGVDEIAECEIVIVPSILLSPSGWQVGRYPKLTDWVMRMHANGARICSACSGVFLLAETGLFDGRDATVHFGYAKAFSGLYPGVAVHPERVLVISGRHEELVSSGASNTWHDLVLYLIAHHVGATVAQDVARNFALQWHQDGLTPYMVFEGRTDHGDAEIAGAQAWLQKSFLGWQPGRGDDPPLAARRAHLQAPLRRRHRADAHRLCPAPEDRGRQASARTHRRLGRGHQLAGRLRGPRLLPTAVQADNGHGPGRLPAAVPDPGVRAHSATVRHVRRNQWTTTGPALTRTAPRKAMRTPRFGFTPPPVASTQAI
jgi:transcriptional regulator GlxA family with amidase domain